MPIFNAVTLRGTFLTRCIQLSTSTSVATALMRSRWLRFAYLWPWT